MAAPVERMQDGKFQPDITEAPSSTASLMSLFSLKGKTAIVTGAGAGIGYACAQGFAEAGADVAIWYNSNEVAVQKAAQIEKDYGGKCKAYKVDVSVWEQVKAAVDQCVDDFGGRLDIMVANAGVAWEKGNMIDGPLEHYHKVMRTNMDGTFHCARAAGAVWRRQKSEGTLADGKTPLQGFTYGSFVATSSMSGHIVNVPQLQAAYNASKAGIRHLCVSLAVEWAGFARANSVSPGYILTELSNYIPAEMHAIWKSKIPMGREGLPQECSGTFLYLASDASSYTTGADIVCDGGYSAP